MAGASDGQVVEVRSSVSASSFTKVSSINDHRQGDKVIRVRVSQLFEAIHAIHSKRFKWRQLLLVQDLMETEASLCRLACYGTFVHLFQQLNLKANEELVIFNPASVTRPTFQEPHPSYLQIILDDEDDSHSRIHIIRPPPQTPKAAQTVTNTQEGVRTHPPQRRSNRNLSSSPSSSATVRATRRSSQRDPDHAQSEQGGPVDRQQADPSREEEPASLQQGPSEQKTAAAKEPKSSAKANAAQPERAYKELSECVISSVRYNVWAVISHVSRAPTPTKKKSIMAQVFLKDPSLQRSGAHQSDYQFSIIGVSVADFPPLEVGSVIRIHHMLVETYNGMFTGRVFNPNCVTVITGQVNSPFDVFGKGANFQFTEHDEEQVRRLRLWWQDLQLYQEKRVCELTSAATFDLPGKVLAVLDGVGDYCRVVRVTDGTKSSLNLLSVSPDSSSLNTLECLCNRTEVDVFVAGHEGRLPSILKPNACILFCRAQCIQEVFHDSVNSVRALMNRIILPDKPSSSIQPLDPNHWLVKSMAALRPAEDAGPAPATDFDLCLKGLNKPNDSTAAVLVESQETPDVPIYPVNCEGFQLDSDTLSVSQDIEQPFIYTTSTCAWMPLDSLVRLGHDERCRVSGYLRCLLFEDDLANLLRGFCEQCGALMPLRRTLSSLSARTRAPRCTSCKTTTELVFLVLFALTPCLKQQHDQGAAQVVLVTGDHAVNWFGCTPNQFIKEEPLRKELLAKLRRADQQPSHLTLICSVDNQEAPQFHIVETFFRA